MKVSVSLPDDDVEFLDAYAHDKGLASPPNNEKFGSDRSMCGRLSQCITISTVERRRKRGAASASLEGYNQGFK